MRPRHLLPPPLRASLFNGCTSVPVQVFASGDEALPFSWSLLMARSHLLSLVLDVGLHRFTACSRGELGLHRTLRICEDPAPSQRVGSKPKPDPGVRLSLEQGVL